MIPAASLLQAQRTVADGGDDDRLAPDDPALGVSGGRSSEAATAAALSNKLSIEAIALSIGALLVR